MNQSTFHRGEKAAEGKHAHRELSGASERKGSGCGAEGGEAPSELLPTAPLATNEFPFFTGHATAQLFRLAL